MDYLMNVPNSDRLLEKWSRKLDVVAEEFTGRSKPFSDDLKMKLAVLLENTQQAMNRTSRLYETTQATAVGPYKRYAFDIITAVMASLIAEEIVSVQALPQKIGQIFFLRYHYGSTKGGVTAGDRMIDPHSGMVAGYDNINYSSEVIADEVAGESGSGTYTGNLAYIPVQPGTVRFHSVFSSGATFELTDDGNGNLEGDMSTASATATINYDTGEFFFNITGFSASAVLTADVLVDYEFDLEYAPSTIPKVDVSVAETIITARPRKLRALYAFDASYDLQVSQGIDIDAALLEAVVAEIRHEIDGEIMNDLLAQANISSVWNMKVPTGVSQRDHRLAFIDEISSAANEIFQRTRRAVGNFIVCGKVAADILESIGEPRFKASGTENPTGPHFAGTLDGRFKVYKNPFYGAQSYLIGYKGNMLLDAGYVYAPYLPIFHTQVIMLDDFIGRRGFATSYGKRMVNTNLYVKGRITNV